MDDFANIWAVDFEFAAPPGSLPTPRCVVARNVVAVGWMERHGIPMDVDMLARLRRYWPTLKYRLVADVNARYGVFVPTGRRLPDAESKLGSALRQEADSSGVDVYDLADAVNEYWRAERDDILAKRSALAVARKRTGLTPGKLNDWEAQGCDLSTWPHLDKVARQLADEVPELGIDPEDEDGPAQLWERLREPLPRARAKHDRSLIHEVARRLVNTGPPRWTGKLKFSASRWEAWLRQRSIAWPRLASGRLALDDKTFREMAKIHPDLIQPVADARHVLSAMRLEKLVIGPDGRNRCLLSPFGTKTGRNAPSTNRFAFGLATWLRFLIRPGPGRAIAYIDWQQQELFIAAALSGDSAMQEAVRSGDFYLSFAKQAGAIPADATKQTHGKERDVFKVVALATQYGISARSLANRLDVSEWRARELLQMHRRTFPQYWQWSECGVASAELRRQVRTCFGWQMRVSQKTGKRTLQNWPVQAHGAEMMRVAAILATERGIGVCCPVHDAFLIEASIDDIDAEAQRMAEVMREASEIVLPGFPLRTDVKIVRFPDWYSDPRGVAMWERVTRLLDELEA